MRLGFCQYAVVHGDRNANFALVARRLEGVKADLLVLPEFFGIGYAFGSREEVWRQGEELLRSETVSFLQSLAGDVEGLVTGTLAERDGERLYDTAVLVSKDGLLASQRKIHLTEYEKRFFEPGNSVSVYEWQPRVRVGMMSCFDCWFAEYSALMKQGGVTLICSSCSFSGGVTPGFMPVRALENQAFLICCNRVGEESFGEHREKFCGKSQILSPDGQPLAQADGQEALMIQEVDMNTADRPIFGSRLSRNFPVEHARYDVTLKR